MVIVLFSNYLNHHQLPILEAFNAIPYINYYFVATETIPEFRIKLGYKKIESEYLIDVNLSKDNKQLAYNLAVEADVAIFLSSGVEEYEIKRLKTGKLTFDMSERWLKKGLINLLSPRLWKRQIVYYLYGRNKPLYMLCNSAYAPNDYYLLQSYKDRCFKWGYFPAVHQHDEDSLFDDMRYKTKRIMWCARFISWKHPEHVISLGLMLREKGYSFEINMYGNGPLLESVEKKIKELCLSKYIHVKGNTDNDTILHEMTQHSIFLFTSDRNEGWGVVANEAMNSGCTVIASTQIGAVPYLIKDGHNGLIYNSINQLYDCTTRLLDSSELCERLARNAYNDITTIWNPKIAAERFLVLVENLINNQDTPYQDGPCSKAYPIKLV